jgi:hypothetical protein
MQKVKLIFHRSYVEHPTIKDGFARDVEVELPAGFTTVHLAGARVFDNGLEPKPRIGGDSNALVLNHQDVHSLVGKLLTYIDATFTDQEQRKAQKDIIREKVYTWHQDLRSRSIQIVDSYTKEGAGKHTDTYIN